jgi:hypothetical protein
MSTMAIDNESAGVDIQHARESLTLTISGSLPEALPR